MRLNPFNPSDNPLYDSIYCFGSDDNGGADDGDTGDTGVSASVAAGGRGWGPSRGPNDRDESSNDDQDRRVQSTGSTTNFNIDRSQPSVVADVNGTQRTVYGTQENLDKAVASGDLSPVGNVQDNYTPGTEAAAANYTPPAAGAAAGPALADTNIFSPTGITGEVFQTPYQQSIMTPQQRMESAYIDNAVRNFRTDKPIGLADRSVIGRMTPMEAAQDSYLNDISIRTYGPEDIDIFDPSRPDLARDPSRPAVSIRPQTPADLITAEARAAANQLLGPDRTRPTADEVAAANARFAPSGMTAAEYTGGLAGSIGPTVGRSGPSSFQSPEDRAMGMSQYGMGMQPTTTEVDAYNQAINDQIAAQLGVDSYSPGSFNAMKEVQDRALAGQFNMTGLPGADIPGATRPMDFSDIEAADLRDQGIMSAVQAAREVELETGVPAAQVQGILTTGAQQRAVANRDQMAAEMAADQRLTGASGAVTDIFSGYDQALAPFTSAPGPIGMDQVRADEIDLERQQYEDYINTGQVGRELAPNEVVSFTDFEGRQLSSFKPAQTAEERANQIANFALNKDPRIASAAQQALANTVETSAQGPSPTVGLEGAAVSTPRTAEEMALTGSPTFDQGRQAAQDAFARGEREAELMAEVEREAEARQAPQFLDSTAERAVIEGKDPRAPDYTLAEAQANLEAARAEAYRDKQFGFDTGLPGSIDVFGAKVPTGVGVIEGVADALFNPDAALANAIAERGIRTIDGSPVPEGTANYNPQGLDVVTAGGPIGEGGRTAAYDARGNIVYDSRGIGSQFGDLLTGNRPPENIQDLYDRQRAIQDQQREMQGGDGGEPPILPPVEEAPEEAPVDDQGRQIVKPYQYQPRGPLTYAYTGLPSLAPTRLRPTYTARKTFSPLFPVS